MNKILKGLLIFLAVNICLFFITAFVLINWPIPKKETNKNYDYSSIDTLSVKSFKKNENWIKMRDGNKLFSKIYPSKSKTALILIHGSGSESRYLETLAGNISHDYFATVITPDLRGHGRNLKDQPDINYIGQLEEDIEDIIKYTKDSLHAKKIILAGHSSGGGLVLRYIANSALTKVDKAIMIAPYLGHDAPTVKPKSGGWVTVGIKRWVGLSLLNTIGIEKYNEKPVLFFNRAKAYEDSLQNKSYSYRMAVNFAPKNYEKDIANVRTNSLVLVGSEDESFYSNKFKEVYSPAAEYTDIQIMQNVNHLNIVKDSEVLKKIAKYLSN
ncbi:alpha/beta hydrolase [Haloflavibacter putidus]|uniref:Alpha/beta fold hydrolase n=1 Tax=Haloflavibacter putidus TaxID=2576776 RepID=A0A507ZEQ1_9FLAO|nr:alpha/beta fold hydrolase [Haloflavibacter putidus]TQD36246.1 alpha/beta fold hydrolase [Haloflavibacter putidus]